MADDDMDTSDIQLESMLNEQLETVRMTSRIVPNLRKMGKSKWTVRIIQRRMNEAKELMQEARKRHAALLAISSDEQQKSLDYFVQSTLSSCLESYTGIQDELDDILVSLSPPIENKSDARLINVANQTDVANPGQKANAIPKIKLPSVALPNFDGSYDKWLPFRDQFSIFVIKNVKLQDTDRLHHLRSTLSGEAVNSISHLDITNENFESAWNILTTFYDNKRELVQTYVQNLYSLPSVKQYSSLNMRALRDKVNTSLNALRKLGEPVDKWDSLLLPLLIERLDKKLKSLWDDELGKKLVPPTYEEFDLFLQTRIRTQRAYERREPEKETKYSEAKSSSSRHVNAHAVSTGIPPCIICKQGHSIRKCPTFIEYPIEKRIQLVKEKGRCYNCLARHITSECPSVHRCRECGKKHNSLLHTDDNSKCVDTAALNQQSISSGTATISSHQTTRFQTEKNDQVLLATATINVYSPTGQALIVRALLDQGSEATLITEKVAQRLRLNKIRRDTRIGGVGNRQFTATAIARIDIGSLDKGGDKINTNAIILKSLTKFTPSRAGQHLSFAHLENLLLADHDPFSSDPIDIIIGADIYGSILLPGLRKGKPNEPIAQQTIFGWILSGPISSSSTVPRIVDAHVVSIDDLHDTVKRFWEIEEIPSSTESILTPDERRCVEYFEKTHSRTSEGRYIVRLPFRTNKPPILGNSRNSAIAKFYRLESQLTTKPEISTEYA